MPWQDACLPAANVWRRSWPHVPSVSWRIVNFSTQGLPQFAPMSHWHDPWWCPRLLLSCRPALRPPHPARRWEVLQPVHRILHLAINPVEKKGQARAMAAHTSATEVRSGFGASSHAPRASHRLRGPSLQPLMVQTQRMP